jgi:hypothetical protein
MEHIFTNINYDDMKTNQEVDDYIKNKMDTYFTTNNIDNSKKEYLMNILGGFVNKQAPKYTVFNNLKKLQSSVNKMIVKLDEYKANGDIVISKKTHYYYSLKNNTAKGYNGFTKANRKIISDITYEDETEIKHLNILYNYYYDSNTKKAPLSDLNLITFYSWSEYHNKLMDNEIIKIVSDIYTSL